MPSLRYLDSARLNGGAPRAALAASHITPNELLFARSHGPVPTIDAAAWRLRVAGFVDRHLSLTLQDLAGSFPVREVDATLLCAGFRRDEFLAVGPLPGELPWSMEPAGTTRWRGYSLWDVLNAARIRSSAQHVGFIGLDQVERHGEVFGFGGSITIAKAREGGALLAFEMNGEPLTPEHGFPLRMVVPGWIGARSVKWLTEIEVRDAPSSNYFQTRAYRMERVANAQHDVSGGVALDEVALNSVILSPESGAQLKCGPSQFTGWAIGRGGRALTGVELSSDGGRDWHPATLAPEAGRWTWRRWSATVTLDAGAHQVAVRAHDGSGIAQPEHVADLWNVKGYANNAWHRVNVDVTG